MRVPTSVLLAVLAAAGLLALAPALVRRYDATERLVAERASSTARVLERRRRRRTVPGRRPINPSRVRSVTLRASSPPNGLPGPGASGLPVSFSGVPVSGVPVSGVPVSGVPVSGVPVSGVPVSGVPVSSVPVSGAGGLRRRRPLRSVPAGRRRRPARQPVRRHTPAVYRRRRVFAGLVLLNLVELVGVLTVGPGFWVSVAVTGTLLAVYVVHLRNRTIIERRRRRAEAREAAWLA
ncbi:MAG TPA: hypothetical protein VES42_02715, partial [Pilimelia sp.]|nr:hypothetical protein [Pilimelia sp.]